MAIQAQEKNPDKIPAVPETPKETIERKTESEEGVIPWIEKTSEQKEVMAQAPEAKGIETEVAREAEKSELRLNIEKILSSENLTKIFNELPSEFEAREDGKNNVLTKEQFAQKGDETALEIEGLISGQNVTIKKIQEIIHEWLILLPDMKNEDPFIEQEELNVIHILVEYLENILQKQIE